jgi:putative heme iron utilization protein
MLKSTVRALQALLDGQRHVAIAVLAGEVPYAGLLPFAPLADRSGVLIHASRMSRHTQGLGTGARIGTLIHEPDLPDGDPLQIKRAMFECVVTLLERDTPAYESARERYLARFPGSRITFRLRDFNLYRLDFESGLYVAGFGRAMEILPRDIRRLAEP